MWSLTPATVVAAGASVLIVASCTGGQGPHRESTGGPSRSAATSSGADVLALSVPRAVHKATVLNDRRVLFSGGCALPGCEGFERAQVTEIFDPVTKTGVMLIAGTADFDSALETTDVLAQEGWSAGPRLRQGRVKHAAMTLPNDTVLVIGGAIDPDGRELLSSTELVDIATGRSRPGPDLSEGQYKLDGAVTKLADGRVVIAGGQRVEVYDPRIGKITVAGGAPAVRRSFVSVSAVGASTVLVAGGYDSAITPTADVRLVRVG
jgi:hypothetical protein